MIHRMALMEKKAVTVAVSTAAAQKASAPG